MIKFNFFGKNCVIDRALSQRVDLENKLKQKGFDFKNILLLNQIHSAEVVIIDDERKIYGDSGLPKADAIVTNLTNVVIGVVTADCSPILLRDESKNIIAATHAGWRGARNGVIKATIDEMKKLGAKNIEAEIGPMISQNSYQISQEFLDDFLNENLSNKNFFIKDIENGKYKFDLPSYVEEKIRAEGVEAVKNCGIDTYKNEENFFSFRRSNHQGQTDCGRNISVIVIN